jgi:vacuolar-type H+-ATPase subunit E/Vma4
LKRESRKENEKIASEIVKIASEKSKKIFSSTYSSFF